MSGKRSPDRPPATGNKRRTRRSSSPPPSPSGAADVDHLVHHLAGLGGATGTCSPVFSPTHNLLALASPAATPAEHAFPLFDPFLDPLALPPPPIPPPGLGITLSHLSSPLSSVVPRVQVRLTIPTPLSALPPAVTTTGVAPGTEQQGKVTLLSWSPEGESLLAVCSYPAHGGGDHLTLFDHRSPCLDEGWTPVLQEAVSRFSPTTSPSSSTSLPPFPSSSSTSTGAGKKVLSIRWVGEPRRWYPTPPFPESRQNEAAAGKPLYCAPARSAAVGDGVAFVAVLDTDELLFIHVPRLVPLTPRILLLPLSPSPSPSPTTSSPNTSHLSFSAPFVPPTPLPFASTTAEMATAAMAAETSPQATMDALVTSLVVSSSTAGLGVDTTATAAAGTGAAALKDELSAASASASAEVGVGGGARLTRVRKAAIGAARSRGTAEVGETWFVVARWVGGGTGRGQRPQKRSGKEGKKEGDQGEGVKAEKVDKVEVEDPLTALAQPTVPEAADPGAGGMIFDDADLSLFADFTSLDEAFGTPAAPPVITPAAPAVVSPLKPDIGAISEGEKKDEGSEEDEEWDVEDWEAEEGGRGDRDKWRVELTEVRVEMASSPAGSLIEGGGGPRLTVRPQPPLYLDPSPAPSSSSSDDHVLDTPTSDPLLTHLTFLGDVSLPHPLSALTSPSASLSADGSEPAVDLCLLSILVHPSSPSSPSGDAGERTTSWRSTLTSYQLSLSPSGYGLSEAFHALEGRRLDAPNAFEGDDKGGWAGRKAASRGVGEGGVVSAVEIRPGGGEWASFVVAVAEPEKQREEDGEGAGREEKKEEEAQGWRTRLVALDSVTLEPLDHSEETGGLPNGINGHDQLNGNNEGAAMTKVNEEHRLPGSTLYSFLALSSNGGLVCTLPFVFSPSIMKPVIAAGALGRNSVPFTTRLSVRLAIALTRQTSTSDLSGLIVSPSAEQAQAVIAETAGILQKMLGENAQLEGNALGWELLGVVSGVYNAIPSLRPLAQLANSLLSLSILVRSFNKSFSPLRAPQGTSSSPPVWRVEEASIWPLVGWTGWFCDEWLDEVLSSITQRTKRKEDEKGDDLAGDPTFLLLHPLSLSLLLRALDHLTSFRDFLIASSTIAAAGEAAGGGGASETVELARLLVEDSCKRAGGGRGVYGVREVVKRIKSEVLGGEAPSTTKHSPPLLITLTLPASLAAQATAARQIIADSFPSLANSSSTASSLPTPPGTPSPIDEGWDAVRRARLIPGQSSLPPSSSAALLGPQRLRQCLRCGRKTAAAETVASESATAVWDGAEKWRRFEEEWEGRCVCGGGWVRGRG
ncbi:hypothetical protein JCM11251_004465 [Rhodosporidiobolus azoricus]